MKNLIMILTIINEKINEYGIYFFFLAFLRVFKIDKLVDKLIIKRYQLDYYELKEEPLVSIIIPTFNGERDGLEKLLKSLFSQDYKNIEIIAIDSASTDNTIKILKKYNCKIIKIKKDDFRHDYARNLGVKKAKGKYLLFTVQDANFINKNYIRKAVSILENNPNIISFSAKQKAKKNSSLYAKFLSEFFVYANGYKYDYNIIGNKYFSKLKFLIRNDQLGRYIHLDDTNHLTRKSFFIENKYGVNTCEDMEYSKKILSNDLYFIYSNVDYIEHSHEYNDFIKYFQRILVDTQVIYELIGIKKSFLNLDIEKVISDYFNTICKLINYQLELFEEKKDILNINLNDIINIKCNLLPFMKIKNILNINKKFKINKIVFYQYLRFFKISYNFLKNNFNLTNYSKEEIKDTLVLISINFLAHKISYYNYLSINKKKELRDIKWV